MAPADEYLTVAVQKHHADTISVWEVFSALRALIAPHPIVTPFHLQEPFPASLLFSAGIHRWFQSFRQRIVQSAETMRSS
jgi:hypothetical protein